MAPKIAASRNSDLEMVGLYQPSLYIDRIVEPVASGVAFEDVC